ncbi:MAG: hypothetical protein IBJ09_09290 [Bacteroidia bacterium]|nr:hypothetical protein [Bacteroidia bacterium]
MQEPFDILKSLDRAQAPELYPQLMQRIEETRRRRIPVARVRTVTLLFICLLSAEAYITFRQHSRDRQREAQLLVSPVDNSLYHE